MSDLGTFGLEAYNAVHRVSVIQVTVLVTMIVGHSRGESILRRMPGTAKAPGIHCLSLSLSLAL